MSDDLSLDSEVRTDLGRARENNEDAAGCFEPDDAAVLAQRGALYVVADGMGGHLAGEVASDFAVKKILHEYYALPWDGPQETLTAAVQAANAAIYDEGQRDAERAGMGSTVVAAVVRGDEAVVASAGDSRVYLLRDGTLRQLTRDHTWVADRLADGTLTAEQAVDHPNRNVITRNLGHRPVVQADITSVRLRPGDRLLLCSDGLWGMLPDDEIAAVMARGTAADAARALIDAANAAGGGDNIGVAVIGIGPRPRAAALTPPALASARARSISARPSPARVAASPAPSFPSAGLARDGAPRYNADAATRRVAVVGGRRGLHGVRLFAIATLVLVPLAIVGAFVFVVSRGGGTATKQTAAAASASVSAVPSTDATTAATGASVALPTQTASNSAAAPATSATLTPTPAAQTADIGPITQPLAMTSPDPSNIANAASFTFCIQNGPLNSDHSLTLDAFAVSMESEVLVAPKMTTSATLNDTSDAQCFTLARKSLSSRPAIYVLQVRSGRGVLTPYGFYLAIDTHNESTCDKIIQPLNVPTGIDGYCAVSGDTPLTLADARSGACSSIDPRLYAEEIAALNPNQLIATDWALVPEQWTNAKCKQASAKKVLTHIPTQLASLQTTSPVSLQNGTVPSTPATPVKSTRPATVPPQSGGQRIDALHHLFGGTFARLVEQAPKWFSL